MTVWGEVKSPGSRKNISRDAHFKSIAGSLCRFNTHLNSSLVTLLTKSRDHVMKRDKVSFYCSGGEGKHQRGRNIPPQTPNPLRADVRESMRSVSVGMGGKLVIYDHTRLGEHLL